MRLARLTALAAIALALLAAPLAAEAQRPTTVYRIGVLTVGPSWPPEARAQFVEALQALGYVAGRDMVLEVRAAGGVERLPAMAAELVALSVNIIMAFGTPAARAAKQATQTIPIVFQVGADPVAEGLVSNFARPGGNLTGLMLAPLEIDSKRLELLKETVPRLARVGYLRDGNYPQVPGGPGTPAPLSDVAARLGLSLYNLDLKTAADLDVAFRAAVAAQVGALQLEDTALVASLSKEIIVHALKYRLPTIGHDRGLVTNGLLMSYGSNRAALVARRAVYIDRILKGVKPADLPVERPSKFELVINLKTAKALGLTIPPAVLARADEIIR